MAIRLSGLISGMDTDALVQELVSAYSVKKDNYVKAQTKLEWKMDAWKSLNTKVYSFYSKSLSNMRFSTNYSKKTTKVSDDTKAIIKAETTAVNGDQTLEINRLAKTGYLTGADLSEKYTNSITGSTKLSELDPSISGGIINVTVDGKEKNFEITGDMTVNKFVAQLKSAGLNASFDETNQRMFVSSKTSGEQHDFSLTGNTEGVKALQALGIFAVSAADTKKYEQMAAYTADDMENYALNDYLSSKIADANKTYTDKNTELEKENEQLNLKLKYANMSSENKAKSYGSLVGAMEKLQEQIAELQADTTTDNTEAIKKKEEQLAKYQSQKDIYDEVNTKYGIEITGNSSDSATYTTVSTPSDDEIVAYKTQIEDTVKSNKETIEANTKAVEANNKLLEKTYETADILDVEFTSYSDSGDVTQKISADYATDATYQSYLAKYQDMKDNAQDVLDGNAATSDAVRISGEDSEIVLNGATFKSNTNNYAINGLSITATGLTDPGEKITVTTATDVDGVYDMVKDFLTSYNELIKEMDTLFGASSAKGYEPLTDEEKDAMTDKEIEKWETKIKDSLLRRDDTLDSLINSMKTAMSKSYEIDGETYSLSSFGIKTLGYFMSGENEKGVYHIDGDEDDTATSGNVDKLRTAIANDPDTVVSFLSKLSTGLYDTLTKKMASSTLSSAYTVYNDKDMKSKYEDYDDTIEKWEEKVADIEDKYYKQFASMETALAQLQSSTTALSQLMGTA